LVKGSNRDWLRTTSDRQIKTCLRKPLQIIDNIRVVSLTLRLLVRYYQKYTDQMKWRILFLKKLLKVKLTCILKIDRDYWHSYYC
jgi:hypothetical protein